MLTHLFSKPQSSLSMQAKRLVAMRFLIYTGFQTSYFIGVIGTLTYADDASVVATSLAVLFMNVFVILGSFAGGAALDAWGPCRHFLLSIVDTLATGAAILVFGSATGIVLLGAALLGFVMGFAQPIATSYPAYLTDDPVELKDINSAIAMFSNVSIIVGPTLGGFVAAAASSRAVLGAVVAFRMPPRLVSLKTLLVALMSVGLGCLLYVGTPYVGVALIGQIALGIAWGVVNPLHNTIVQTTAPLEQLGRVNSVMGFGNMFAGVAPLAIAPWLAAIFGVQQTLVGAGMVVTAVPAALLLFGRRHFDRSARQ